MKFQLSLRENPLVVRFVTDMSHNPASLLELSARCVKLHNMDVRPGDVPNTLLEYLQSGHRCVNPNCKGKRKPTIQLQFIINKFIL